MTAGTLSRSERIARFNDWARQAMSLACVVVATEGLVPEEVQSQGIPVLAKPFAESDFRDLLDL